MQYWKFKKEKPQVNYSLMSFSTAVRKKETFDRTEKHMWVKKKKT